MKFLFASDIHGSFAACKAILQQLETEKADRLILLGDLLYHGPRNPLPDEYSPMAVSDALNKLAVKPLAVRGNCDSEVDQMVLSFPIMADYTMLPLHSGHIAFITHGHLYNIHNMPQLSSGDLIIHGHTHINTTEEHAGVTYINPGSAALPHEGQPKSYMTLDWDNDRFEIKAFDGSVIRSLHA
ncbi:MAG TPA: phosphodiesterase [Candidatus Limiplasma sp.]|nr:phosphodiesterase [Candidatus Limiplasma sp.]HRX09112.1 phosphodiesterase [Candidatus Limiplasma sp.]